MGMEELQPFSQRVVHIALSIPFGRVTSYGHIAAAADSPRSARQVARLLHTLSGPYQLPWHRVVNKSGCIALRDSELFQHQLVLLRGEGVEVNDTGQVQSYADCLWVPLPPL